MSLLSTGAVAALITAVLVTMLEMTDIVTLLYAFSTQNRSMKMGISGAIIGIVSVSIAAILLQRSIVGIPDALVHAAETVLLWSVGGLLTVSTVKSYVREEKMRIGSPLRKKVYPPLDTLRPRDLLLTGLTVGGGETMEAAIPLLALSFQGYGNEAGAGAIVGGIAIVIAGILLHDQIKRIKAPALKWFTTSFVLAFALLSSLETMGEVHFYTWPPTWLGTLPTDVLLLPFGVVGFLLVGIVIRLSLAQLGLSWGGDSKPRKGRSSGR